MNKLGDRAIPHLAERLSDLLIRILWLPITSGELTEGQSPQRTLPEGCSVVIQLGPHDWDFLSPKRFNAGASPITVTLDVGTYPVRSGSTTAVLIEFDRE